MEAYSLAKVCKLENIDFMFYRCTNLKEVKLSNNLTEILLEIL